jgi:aryl-alcohol dehydrogenase-like predicted oxidoreductase
VKERYPEAYLRKNMEERLEMLSVKQIDILLLHMWTRAWNDDPTPLRALHTLEKVEKIGYIGVSN